MEKHDGVTVLIFAILRWMRLAKTCKLTSREEMRMTLFFEFWVGARAVRYLGSRGSGVRQG